MTCNALVFDMDDTLYEERHYVSSGFAAIDSWLSNTYNLFGFYETAMELFNSGERSLIFNKTLLKLKIVYDDSTIKEMVEVYRSHKPDIQLSTDASWILEKVRETVKIGLISDGYLISQEKKVEALKLLEKFHSVILTDKLGRENWKPSLVPYEQASQELGVPHSQCVYIGDNVNKDFYAAKKLGWTTVQIDRKEGIYSGIAAEEEFTAHYKIDSLKNLMELPMLKHMFTVGAE
ncbi:HAD family hydrolase [Paenibacillus sp. LjRoot153]|uniref:HAD family hydrolase n=1 Tax=Paenibacillus sp. LjRoot153 TaxID=3342270 RepID=UPI003ECE437B